MKTRKILLVMLVFSFISTVGISPTKAQALPKSIDSLESVLKTATHDTVLLKTYAELFREYRRRDLPKAKEYLELEIALADKLGDKESIYAAKNRLAIYHSINRELDKANVILIELRDYYKSTGNRERESVILSNISTNFIETGQLKLALETQFEALKIDEELGLTGVTLGKNYFTIANILRLNEEPKLAIEWLEKALIEYRSEDAKEFEAQTIYTLGMSYHSIDSLDKAEALMEQSLDYFRSVNNIPAIAVVLRGLGTMAKDQKDYNRTLELYSESLEISQKMGDNRREIECLLALGEIYEKRKEYDLAIPYLRKSLELSRKQEVKFYDTKILQFLSQALYATGKHKEAYELKSDLIVLNDSIQVKNNKAAITELDVKYQTEKKEQEIVLLEERNKRQSLEKKGMIGGLIGLIALGFSLFYAMRQKLNRNKLEKEKLDQELQFRQKELDLQNKELTAYALQLAHKNEILEGIRSEVSDINSTTVSDHDLQKVLNTISINQNDESSWVDFRSRFLAVHNGFETNVKEKFPTVTNNEMRLMALLKMNLSSKEIANILNISSEGIKKARYRLRKKLLLQPNDSLEDLVIKL